jgi:hypothetical protein
MLDRNELNSAVFDLVEHQVAYLEDLSDALQVLVAIGDSEKGELVNSGSHWVIRHAGVGTGNR